MLLPKYQNLKASISVKFVKSIKQSVGELWMSERRSMYGESMTCFHNLCEL